MSDETCRCGEPGCSAALYKHDALLVAICFDRALQKSERLLAESERKLAEERAFSAELHASERRIFDQCNAKILEYERKLFTVTAERDESRESESNSAVRYSAELEESERKVARLTELLDRSEDSPAMKRLREGLQFSETERVDLQRKVARLDSALTELVAKRDADLTRAGTELARLERELKVALYNVEMLKRNQ